MAKDPAVLFYTSDFLSGTLTMTDEDVGKYIKLLCLQHQKGRLSEKDMLYICKTYVEDVFSKFIKDDQGCYYNERMEEESLKRKNYSLSRKRNVSARYKEKSAPTYVEHMENENENENVNVIKDKKRSFQKPTLEEITAYIKERGAKVDPEKFFDFYESKGWMVGKNKMKDWKACLRTWQKSEAEIPEAAPKGPRPNLAAIEKRISDQLGKIATKDLIKNCMKEIPQNLWWAVEKFLKQRYPGSDSSSYMICESELIREKQG